METLVNFLGLRKIKKMHILRTNNKQKIQTSKRFEVFCYLYFQSDISECLYGNKKKAITILKQKKNKKSMLIYTLAFIKMKKKSILLSSLKILKLRSF